MEGLIIIEITKGILMGEVCRDEMFIKGISRYIKSRSSYLFSKFHAVAKRLSLTNNDINSLQNIE